MGTWNVRTLNKPGALQYLLDAIKKYKISIIALQKIRWPNDGNMKKEDKIIFYSGRKDGRHENNVGFVVSDVKVCDFYHK